MSGSCRVRELELVGADRKTAAESSRRVAEALRLATFPAEDLPGRLLIRRLDLAFMSERASAAHGSRVASRALGDAWSSAVWFAEPGAASANAVLAPRAVDVWIEVARRLCGASALDLSAWFWPLLLGERFALGDRRGMLAACVETLLTPESGSAALPRLASVIAALVDGGTPAPLVEVLGPQHTPGLLRELAGALGAEAFAGGAPPRATADLSEGSDDRSRHAERAHFERLEPRWRRLLEAFVPSWGAADVRSTWLCFTALWAPHPSRAALPSIEQSARRLARAVMASARAEHTSRGTAPSGASSALDRTRPATTPYPSPRSSSAEALPPPVPRGSGAGAASSAPQATTLAARADTARVGAHAPNDAARAGALTPSDAAPVGPPAPGDGARETPAASDEGASFTSFGAFRPSEFAGLLFILPILARLGLEGFLARHPALVEWDLVPRLLTRFADALEVPDADPMRRVLGPLAADGSPELGGVELPDAWLRQLGEAEPLELGRLGARLERATGRDAATLVLVAWERAVVLWLATFTELALPELVRRPGQVALTRTHVDVLFDLNQADVRVRAPALDLNPGFVSHLGRVVTFHYGDRRRN